MPGARASGVRGGACRRHSPGRSRPRSEMKAIARRGIVWDLDGTLIDSARDIREALSEVFEPRRLVAPTVPAVRSMIGAGVRRLIERALAACGEDPRDELVGPLAAEFVDRYGENPVRHTRLYAHAAETLERLAGAGYVHAICTNKPLGLAVDIVARLGVGHFFATVIGGDSGAKRKPDPGPVIACLDGLAVAPSAAVMVGDSAADVDAARAAGVAVVAVNFGYSDVPVTALRPDAVIERLDALPAKLVELFSGRTDAPAQEG